MIDGQCFAAHCSTEGALAEELIVEMSEDPQTLGKRKREYFEKRCVNMARIFVGSPGSAQFHMLREAVAEVDAQG